ALTELFDRHQGAVMTLADYNTIGGISGALSRRAEEQFAALDENGQAAARQLFLRLISVNEGAGELDELPDTRRRALRAELEALQTAGSFAKSDMVKVIDDYGRFRLLTFDRDPVTRSPTVEVAHESLLYAWSRLRDWLDRSRADVRQQRLLASAANEWLASGQDEGFLLHDARLEQFSGWAKNSSVVLTHEEQSFLDAGRSAQQSRWAAEEARRRQELETARKLAETERRRAEEQALSNRRLRQRAFALALALIIAAILAILANSAGRRANENARAAQSSADLAATREAQALSEAIQLATAEALAIREREEAEAQSRQARARALAGAAVKNLEVDPELSVLLALQAVETTYAIDETWVPEAVDALHHAVRAASRLQNVMHHSAGAMNNVSYSPDGSYLAASTLLPDQDIMTTVWDAHTGQELFTLPSSIARFTPDSTHFITWRTSGLTLIYEIWDIDEVEIEETVSLYIDDLQYSAGGEITADWHYVTLRYWDNSIKVWDTETNEMIGHFTEHDDMVNAVLFSPDKTLLGSVGRDGLLKVWPIPTWSAGTAGETSSILTMEHSAPLETLAFSPDNRYLAAVGRDFTAVFLDLTASLNAGSPVTAFTFPLTGHAETVVEIAFSADGSRLAVLSQDGLITVWAVNKGEELFTLVSNEHTRRITFSPDGSKLVTVNDGGEVQIWDVSAAAEKEWLTLTGHDGAVNKLAYSPDGSLLATVSNDETIKLWHTGSGRLYRTLQGHSAHIRAVTFCPDGSCLATAANDGKIKLWDMAAGLESITLDAYTDLPLNPIPENNVLDLAFTPDGRQLVSVGMDEVAEVWDTTTGERTMLLEGHWYNVVGTAVSLDGRLIATTGPDGMMIIWDSQTGELLWIQETSQYGSKDVAFSPDGNRAATADNDGTVRVWDLNAAEGERLLLSLAGHGSSVRSVAYSPDGRFIASAGANQIHVWDAQTGEALYTLPGHKKVVLDIAFSPNGSYLAGAGADGTVRIYLLPVEELMTLARSRLTRSLTDLECQRYLQLAECPAPP
ncbi:MAG: hypothetical protein R3293_25810, partial [Candidatus Promineifilaceae bacterium]|nr:hypothetical protein [Candidatus Promineifilaceae bacterium]